MNVAPQSKSQPPVTAAAASAIHLAEEFSQLCHRCWLILKIAAARDDGHEGVGLVRDAINHLRLLRVLDLLSILPSFEPHGIKQATLERYVEQALRFADVPMADYFLLLLLLFFFFFVFFFARFSPVAVSYFGHARS